MPPFSRSTCGAFIVVLMVVLAGCAGTISDAEPGKPGPDATTTDTATGANATQNASTGLLNVSTGTLNASNGTLEVHYINVGQSLSVLVVGPTGETMLYDTGHYQDDGEHVLDYLRAHDVERIDHLVVSHNDADHLGGNAAIIEYFETQAEGIGAIYDPGIAASTQTYAEYLDAVEAHGVTLYETREGDSIRFEGVNVSVLGPPELYLEDEARNENSIVLELEYGNTSFLFTGDAEDDQEAYLVAEYGERLNATVLKAGHHGSSTSTSGDLLDAVQPKAVVVSSAYESQYGHPAEVVLERLANRSISTYWTATHGDVALVSDGRNVSVHTQAAATVDPASLREGEPVEPASNDSVVERARLGEPMEGVQTETQTTAVPDGGTTEGGLAVVDVHADAAGDERDNLNDEYVVFENTGEETLDLSGWTVEDEVGHTYTFPEGTTLEPGERVTLYTGSGTDAESARYWGSGSPIWNNDGDTVIVRNSQGDVVIEESYG